jgi:glutamyl-Q tRNA(Asp) synthetase
MPMTTPVFRFAPSPNGRLHLGHAASALVNARLAAQTGGRFLLRIEDIDTTRCRPEFTDGILEDLAWLGLTWEEPVIRQSSRFQCYQEALARLEQQGLLYPCFCSRSQIMKDSAGLGRDPDGALLYGGRCRALTPSEQRDRTDAGERLRLRLRMGEALARCAAPLQWREVSPGGLERVITADPAAWGDVVLRRKEFPASYHIAVVVDDAAQGVTHVVRGEDLHASTAIHRLLHQLLVLPEPIYRHHALLRDASGAKLSKSIGSRSLADMRKSGMDAGSIRALASLEA